LTEAQRLQQQDIANQLGFGTTQLGLGTQQQQFETGITSQLGGAGAGAQTYSQSISRCLTTRKSYGTKLSITKNWNRV
jgi:hypothetical protein